MLIRNENCDLITILPQQWENPITLVICSFWSIDNFLNPIHICKWWPNEWWSYSLIQCISIFCQLNTSENCEIGLNYLFCIKNEVPRKPRVTSFASLLRSTINSIWIDSQTKGAKKRVWEGNSLLLKWALLKNAFSKFLFFK